MAPLSDPTPPGTIPKKTGPAYWNRLYHQKKDGSFEDVTEREGVAGIGYGMGVAIGDYDNDGYEDLYVTEYGRNILYHNNGDETFTDVTSEAGVGGSGWSTSATWVDYDNDGKLDLVVARYLTWDFPDLWCGEHEPGHRAYCHPGLLKPTTFLVHHNEDGKHFREVFQTAGFTKPAKGLGVAIADYEHDAIPISLWQTTPCPSFYFITRRMERLKKWLSTPLILWCAMSKSDGRAESPALTHALPQGLPALAGSCSIRDKHAVLTVVNPRLEEKQETEIAVQGRQMAGMRIGPYCHRYSPRNTFDEPNAVHPMPDNNARAGSPLVYSFAPASVSVWSWI